jgi:hypothetical protein
MLNQSLPYEESFGRTETIYIGSAKTHSSRVKQEMVYPMLLCKLLHSTLALDYGWKRNVFGAKNNDGRPEELFTSFAQT